jgi:hypothetical protein
MDLIDKGKKKKKREKQNGKAIPITGCGGPQGCETLRLPHFQDSRLRDGSEFVSLTCQPPFTPTEIPGTHFF